MGIYLYTIEHERTETTVSAEKKAQTKAERAEKHRLEEQKDHRSVVVYTVVAVLVVVAAIAAMFWRSGILQRNLTALNINGTKYTAVDLQYYYNSIYNEQERNYAFDSSTSVKRQVYDETTGQTWYDHLMDLAVEQLTRNTALAQQAQSEGYTLSEDAQNAMAATLAQLDTVWISSNMSSRDAFLRANFGSYINYDRFVSLINLEFTATDYAQSKLDAIEHPESDYQTYYQEHADELDTVTFSQITFRARVPSTDSDGNAIQRTDAETAAALEELKPEQKALAEEVRSKLEQGADVEDLIEEYSEQLYTSTVSRGYTSADLTYFPYNEWLLESGRREGDITVVESDAGASAYYYYVVRFEGRDLDEGRTNTVRHLLVRAGDSNTTDPTQEQYDEAEEKATSLLNEWKAGEKTEDSFAALVSANTNDTASASTGGLYADITSTSGYTEAFRDWATDPARKEGDVDLVKTEFGWHIMYYVSNNDPIWRQSVTAALQNQDYLDLADSAAQGWTISRGMGMSFISA